MDNKLSISKEVKASSAYTICSILQRCLSFITLPLFSRLLTTEQYGEFTVYSSWSPILTIFLTLNLAYGSFSTAMIKYENDRDGYISSMQGIFLLLSCIFLAIYLPFRDKWNVLFEMPSSLVLVMIAEIIGFQSLQLWTGKKRFEFNYISVVTVTLIAAVSAPLIAYILVVNSEEKGIARIVGYALANIAIGVIIFIYNLIKGKKLFDPVYWKYAFSFNIPLLAYYLSQVVFNQSDKIMISHMIGKDKAAVYGVAYSLAIILTFVLNAINNSYVPWFYGKLKEGKQSENRRVSVFLAALFALMLLFIIWFAPEIITILAPEAYQEAIYVVAPVAMSLELLFYSQFFINVEFYYEEKKSLVWASIGAAVSNIVLNWIFIRKYGYIAAAYTTLFSYIIFAFSNYVAMRRILKARGFKDDSYNYRWLIILLIAFMMIGTAGVLMYDMLIIRIVITLTVLFAIIAFRSKIIGLYNMLKGN